MTVLVVGATGSIGRLVVEEAVRKGHAVRALVRDLEKARHLFPEVEAVVGDLTRPRTLTAAVDGSSRAPAAAWAPTSPGPPWRPATQSISPRSQRSLSRRKQARSPQQVCG